MHTGESQSAPEIVREFPHTGQGIRYEWGPYADGEIRRFLKGVHYKSFKAFQRSAYSWAREFGYTAVVRLGLPSDHKASPDCYIQFTKQKPMDRPRGKAAR
jgi:hypothetical protein